MKITDVKTYALHTPLTQPFAFSQGWVHKRSATIVEISTDAGIIGWGEAFNQGLEPPLTTKLDFVPRRSSSVTDWKTISKSWRKLSAPWARARLH